MRRHLYNSGFLQPTMSRVTPLLNWLTAAFLKICLPSSTIKCWATSNSKWTSSWFLLIGRWLQPEVPFWLLSSRNIWQRKKNREELSTLHRCSRKCSELFFSLSTRATSLHTIVTSVQSQRSIKCWPWPVFAKQLLRAHPILKNFLNLLFLNKFNPFFSLINFEILVEILNFDCPSSCTVPKLIWISE